MPATQQQFHEGGEEHQRYDAATMQRVIETATRLQQAHRETVTAEQIEEIGREVGLDPQFVRQALDAVVAGREAGIVAPTALSAVPAQTRQVVRRAAVRPRRKVRPLTGTDIVRACAPALFYGVFIAFAMSAFRYSSSGAAEMLFVIWQPLLLTVGTAWRVRRRRRAAITGAAFAFTAVVGTVVGGGFSNGRFDGGVFAAMLFWMLGLATVGAGAAAVSRWRSRWRVVRRDAPEVSGLPAAE